jgi:hypothetical protein
VSDDEDAVMRRGNPGRIVLTYSRSVSGEIPTVTFYATHDDAAWWSKFNQSIAGSRWEYMGDGVAYAMCDDCPETYRRARKEGYRLGKDETHDDLGE